MGQDRTSWTELPVGGAGRVMQTMAGEHAMMTVVVGRSQGSRFWLGFTGVEDAQKYGESPKEVACDFFLHLFDGLSLFFRFASQVFYSVVLSVAKRALYRLAGRWLLKLKETFCTDAHPQLISEVDQHGNCSREAFAARHGPTAETKAWVQQIDGKKRM
jgi:hypothetical protein